MNPVEKLVQVKVYEHLVALLQIPDRLGDRRVTAPALAEAVAARIEGRVVVRSHHLSYCLCYDPIDHIRDAEAPLTAPRFGDPHAADLPRPIGAVEQFPAQTAEDLFQMLTHLFDRLTIRAGSTVVGSHVPERLLQVVPTSHLLHRHRRQRSSPRGLRLRHRARRSHGPTHGRSAVGPLRAVGCLAEQLELSCLFAGRGLLPSPRPGGRGWDRLSTALRYYWTLRLLSSHRRLVLLSSTTTDSGPSAAEAERSPRVRTRNFVLNRRLYAQPPTDIGLRRRSPAHPRVGRLPGASLALGSALHLGLPPDPASRPRPCPLGGRFPPSGSREDFHLLFRAHAGRTTADASAEGHSLRRRSENQR